MVSSRRHENERHVEVASVAFWGGLSLMGMAESRGLEPFMECRSLPFVERKDVAFGRAETDGAVEMKSRLPRSNGLLCCMSMH